ncbi:nucleolar protein 16-like [Stylophora pistillata]|uniref:nucleolar protein 16-like n=1 Tax=Stylophora pistillata TaxID=50429 RepID=UPI000C041E02|nr:nucleolar protein 16-like [Stylophora pistillata]
MAGVRGKKSQKKKRVNTTRPGIERKRKEKKVKVLNQTLRKSWDQEKTLKQNLQILGLAFDANSAIPIPKSKTKGYKDEKVEAMEVDKKEPTTVMREFEQMAANEKKCERHISPGEVQFLWQLIGDHGNNYKGMARDKRNCYQHTPNQLKRKCEALLRSKQNFSGYLEKIS